MMEKNIGPNKPKKAYSLDKRKDFSAFSIIIRGCAIKSYKLTK